MDLKKHAKLPDGFENQFPHQFKLILLMTNPNPSCRPGIRPHICVDLHTIDANELVRFCTTFNKINEALPASDSVDKIGLLEPPKPTDTTSSITQVPELDLETRLINITKIQDRALSVVPPDMDKLELLKTIEQLREIIETQKSKLVEQEKLIAELKLINGQKG